MLEEYNDVLVIEDLCKVLRCGKNTAYQILHDKQIASRIIGGKYIIPKTEVIKFLTKFNIGVERAPV